MLRARIDSEGSLGRVNFQTFNRFADGSGVVRPCLLNSFGPQVNTNVSGFHGIGNHSLTPIAVAKPPNKGLVVGIIKALEIGRRQIVPRDVSPRRESRRWPAPEKYNPIRPGTTVSFPRTLRSSAEQGESADSAPGQDR